MSRAPVFESWLVQLIGLLDLEDVVETDGLPTVRSVRDLLTDEIREVLQLPPRPPHRARS